MLRLAGASIMATLLLTGCARERSDPAVDAVIAAQESVRDEWESQTNTLVKSVVCNETVDLDHFTCTVKHENAAGVERFSRLNVACNEARCVWRER